jgi:serine protease AprX
VLAKHSGIHALTVLMKAGTVIAMAQRADVVSVSPNREVRQTASTLESITGALTSNVRTNSTKTDYSGWDGTGIGIAVLDSGVMKAHDGFRDGSGVTRVGRNVDMFNSAVANWTMGVDTTASLQPGSSALNSYEALIATDDDATQDPFGHGTHVAAVAAGRAKYYGWATPDTTGIAPNAKIFDVRVLDDHGSGTVSDAIEGIQWVIYHAKEYNIRVLNLSLAASSTETWQTDPLCIAVRSATAAGITVVVAAGNFGQSIFGQEVYGAVGAPGNDPSVITVGAVNYHDSVARDDDTVNNFSSRGPTRSSYISSSGMRVVDNLLKPDLVAPGNKIVSAAATTANSLIPTWNFLATTFYSTLVAPLGIIEIYPETQMSLNGTSIAAPAVSGTVALMLQVNPGLTPPLIKAILQYTAQPLPNYNLVQQGAGMLNIDGAIVLASVLRTDIASQIQANGLNGGDSLLADQ